jgi:hypothetical protein
LVFIEDIVLECIITFLAGVYTILLVCTLAEKIRTKDHNWRYLNEVAM